MVACPEFRWQNWTELVFWEMPAVAISYPSEDWKMGECLWSAFAVGANGFESCYLLLLVVGTSNRFVYFIKSQGASSC